MKFSFKGLFSKCKSSKQPPPGYLNPHTTIGELDSHLISEGRHEKLWRALGANVIRDESGELIGTSFAVWAPNAKAVSLICDKNNWDRISNPMIPLGSNGLWELFLADIEPGTKYKYSVLNQRGNWVEHADPMARETEIPPATASIVNESKFIWSDTEWISKRETFQPWQSPISIYEVHLGSWKPGLSYLQLASELTNYVKSQGFTHVEFLPVCEHPYSPSWGYQVTSYFAPTARFGSPDEFRYLVNQLHQAGIGVILDWVPAHFPKDEWALARFDGTALYEHEDPRLGEHPDWGTYIFNYGRNEVRNFLVASALYWIEEFHIDGLRVDAVASMLYLDYSRKEGEWIPNKDGGRENLEAVRFLQEATATAYKKFPGIMMIAEESTAWDGVTRATTDNGLGFGFKWNMGWMHDTLQYLQREPIHRAYHHNEITFSILYAWSENFLLPLSHDEVVHGKRSLVNKFPGDRWQKLATLRALYGYMWSHPGKKLLFMGGEFAQNDEWREGASLDWHLTQYDEHLGIQELIKKLNSIYVKHKELWELDTKNSGFQWLSNNDSSRNILAYSRLDASGHALISITNFSPVPQLEYRLPLGSISDNQWVEILNTDSSEFGGSGVINTGQITAVGIDGEKEITLRVPPLGTLWLASCSNKEGN
jgi:1,4-alpha-glucan branching enzyme